VGELPLFIRHGRGLRSFLALLFFLLLVAGLVYLHGPISVSNFDFSMSNSGGITITQGSSGSNTITASLTSGSPLSVSLSCSGLTSGISGSFNPTSGNPTFYSTLTINTSSSTPVGSYTINVTGSVGGNAHTTQFTLNVNTLTVNPPSNVTAEFKHFVKYFENPLSIPSYNGTDGVVHPDVLYFSNSMDGYKYWMVYTPLEPDTKEQPTIMRSNDGVTWTDAGISNPVLHARNAVWDKSNLADPDMLYVADYNKWFMVYMGADSGDFSRANFKIALAYSADGKTWAEYHGASINGNANPVILSGSDSGGAAWERNGTLSDLAYPTLLYKNDTFYLYYGVANPNNMGPIGLATFNWDNSENSVTNFHRYASNPIINLPADSDYNIGCGHSDVFYYNGFYFMYVLRGKEPPQYYGGTDLVLLSSADGISWTNQGMALPIDQSISWEGFQIYRSCPVTDGIGNVALFDGKVKLYYSASGNHHYGIGMATSTQVLSRP
jgi:hypothetical protein